MSGADKFAFSRFSEKRKLGSDTAGYDEYVEGVEPDETSSLDAPIKEDNRGFKLIQKMGWASGTGLGRFNQGRVDPVPFELKDDHMGLGRWALELELAQDATDKRKQMEIEKEVTEDLVEKYKVQAEKERQIAETLAEMHKSFYCELCDKQYTKYSEYDNHINSYSHHHQQRLKDLKQYETGRKFGGHRDPEEMKKKILSVHMVALERARMNIKRKSKGSVAPAFKPIGQASTDTGGGGSAGASASGRSATLGVKRSQESQESQEKIAQKKAKIAKFGLKFQSAGTLVTIGDQLGHESTVRKPPPVKERVEPCEQKVTDVRSLSLKQDRKDNKYPGSVYKRPPQTSNPSVAGSAMPEKKLSFGFNKKSSSFSSFKTLDTKDEGLYTSTWGKVTSSRATEQMQPQREDGLPSVKGPPPKLMSRQRELTMQGAFDSDSDEEDSKLGQLPVKAPPRFRFNLRK